MLDLNYIRQNAQERSKDNHYTWIAPDRVLAMLEEIERLRAVLKSARGELQCLYHWLDRAVTSDYRYNNDPALPGHRQAAEEMARTIGATLEQVTTSHRVEIQPSTWRWSRDEWFSLPLPLRQRWWAETERSTTEPFSELLKDVEAVLGSAEQNVPDEDAAQKDGA